MIDHPTASATELQAALINDISRPSLRDQFAMAALTGMLADSRSEGTFDEFANHAYTYADAMLEARESKP